MNKKLLIGLGVLAVAGIGLYMWNKSKKSETTSKASGDDDYSEEEFDENEGTDDSDSMDYSDEGYSNFRLPKWLGGKSDDDGFRKCSCAYKKADGSFGVISQTCSNSVNCVDCCEASGNASRVMVKRPRRFM